MSLEIRISASQVETLLDRLQSLDLSPVSKAAAEFVVNTGTEAFTNESLRPSPWDPLSDAYEKKLKNAWSSKAKNKKKEFLHQLLIDSGDLKDSLKLLESPAGSSDGGYIARVASDREYAAYHQFGTSKMPARPFLPINADLSIGTATLTDKAWDTVKPDLISALKRSIES